MHKLPHILTSLYLALLVLAVIPIFTGDDALSGIFAVLLTAPWTMIFARLIEPSEGAIATGIAMVVIGGTINAALTFLVSRFFIRKFGKWS